MKYTQLGRTGLTVSRLALGTMNFGVRTSPEDAHTILDEARTQGINLVDTANSYGGEGARGRTEAIIGDWFVGGGGRRERTVLATKLYETMNDWPHDGGLSALNIRKSLEASLRRLQTDYIDLYQFHHVDRRTAWDEIWQALDVAITQGMILYVGSSNFAGWHLAQAQAAAEKRGAFGLVSEQSIYNLAVRSVEVEVLPAARHYGLGLLPWSPLHGGVLSGIIKRSNLGGAAPKLLSDANSRWNYEQVRAFEDFADELGHEPGDVALAWLLHQEGVTAPVIGPRTKAHLTAALRSTDLALDELALAELNRIFPGHQPAPEEYAW